jgi:hypothetical protein
MRKIALALLLLTSACSTPLPPCIEGSPGCGVPYHPAMDAPPVYIPPGFFPLPYATGPAPYAAPPAYGTIGNPAFCHTQPAGYNTMIVCQ